MDNNSSQNFDTIMDPGVMNPGSINPTLGSIKPSFGKDNMAKNWCGTLNNYGSSDLDRFSTQLGPLCVYYVVGKEFGESGTPHLQFFFSLKTKKRLAALKKIFPTAHLEVKSRNSTMQQASDYCKKDGNFFEVGTLPSNQGDAGLKVIKDNYEETVHFAKTDQVHAINAEHLLKYYPTIKRIRHDYKKMPEDLDWSDGNPPNIWIYGPTGTGKSYRAREILGEDFYSKIAANKWWDKYDGEEGVLIEDIDTSHVYMGGYLKIWADKYAFPVEVKCSADLIRPKVIIVTSNYTIEQIFPDVSISQPLRRRFKMIPMLVPWNATVNDVLKAQPESTSSVPNKKRKYDQPLKKPALLRRNAVGDLVPGIQMQRTLEEFNPDLIDISDDFHFCLVCQMDPCVCPSFDMDEC